MSIVTFLGRLALVALASGFVLACGQGGEGGLSDEERREIAAGIEQRVKSAYDLGSRDVLAGMLSLYPEDGPVYSASGGSVTSSRDSLEAAIRQTVRVRA